MCFSTKRIVCCTISLFLSSQRLISNSISKRGNRILEDRCRSQWTFQQQVEQRYITMRTSHLFAPPLGGLSISILNSYTTQSRQMDGVAVTSFAVNSFYTHRTTTSQVSWLPCGNYAVYKLFHGTGHTHLSTVVSCAEVSDREWLLAGRNQPSSNTKAKYPKS